MKEPSDLSPLWVKPTSAQGKGIGRHGCYGRLQPLRNVVASLGFSLYVRCPSLNSSEQEAINANDNTGRVWRQTAE
jgi:hypothetical protein